MTDQTTEPAALPMLTLEQIVEADDRPVELVEVPEWGGALKMRALCEQQLADAQKAATVDGVLDENRAAKRMLIASIVEPALGPEHEGLLSQKSMSVVARLLQTMVKLNGLGEGFQKAAEAAFREGQS